MCELGVTALFRTLKTCRLLWVPFPAVSSVRFYTVLTAQAISVIGMGSSVNQAFMGKSLYNDSLENICVSFMGPDQDRNPALQEKAWLSLNLISVPSILGMTQCGQ